MTTPSTGPQPWSAYLQKDETLSVEIYAKGLMQEVQSSNLQRLAFQCDDRCVTYTLGVDLARARPDITGRMLVLFKGRSGERGKLWAYDGVTISKYAEILAAESVGSRFNALVKSDSSLPSHEIHLPED